MFKRLTGTMTDLSWPDTDVSYVDDATGETVVESLSLYTEDCLGHRGESSSPQSCDGTEKTGFSF